MLLRALSMLRALGRLRRQLDDCRQSRLFISLELQAVAITVLVIPLCQAPAQEEGRAQVLSQDLLLDLFLDRFQGHPSVPLQGLSPGPLLVLPRDPVAPGLQICHPLRLHFTGRRS